MNEIYDELNLLFTKIRENRQVLKFTENLSYEELQQICDSSSQMTTLIDFDNYSMKYCNQSAYEFLGVTQDETTKLGFKYILKLVHPENMSIVQMFIKYFSDRSNYDNILSHTFYIKSKNGWEWTYACVKPVAYNENGSVKYLLGVGCSIDDLLKTKSRIKTLKNNLEFYEANMDKYMQLTVREKEVLKLIAEEHTSKEIGTKLYISPLTVDTYRKNIIDKLAVKSSIGLVKYAMLFNIM
jgi:DNA-binding CsgD family transcriptional regulator